MTSLEIPTRVWTRRVGSLVIALFCLLGATANAGTLSVQDDAKFFSPAGIQAAEKSYRDNNALAEVSLTVRTIESLPAEFADVPKDFDERQRHFVKLTQSMAKSARAQGVFVLITRNPGHREVLADRRLREHGFTNAKSDELRDVLLVSLKKAKASSLPDEAIAIGDRGLLNLVNVYAAAVPRDGLPPAPLVPNDGNGHFAHPNEHAVPVGRGQGEAGNTISMWWIVGGLALAFLLFRGLMGILRNNSQGGYTPGGSYGAPGQPSAGPMLGGGGGGGMFGSFFSGMLGGAAGSWMYDSFRGRGDHSGGHTSINDERSSFGSDSSSSYNDSGAGDFSGDSGSGGDFGGGDFGGGDSGGGDSGGGDF